MKTFFEGHTKKGLYDLCRKNVSAEVVQKLFGQVWGNSGKNPLNTKCLPAPTLMKTQFRRPCPLLKGQCETTLAQKRNGKLVLHHKIS